MITKFLLRLFAIAPIASGAALLVGSSALALETQSTLSGSESSVPTTSVSSLNAQPLELAQALPTAAPAQPLQTPGTLLADSAQLESYLLEGQGQATESVEQVTSVSQLSDVRPTDWAFQALSNLVERYGCIAGYPDGTYRGNRFLTRYEFAAGLNACLDRVTELIQAGLEDAVTEEDLAALRRLQEEFAAELATIRGLVDSLEARTAALEANQFSTTTKLVGETIFSVSDIFSGDDEDEEGVNVLNDDGATNEGELGNTVFQSRVRLNFDTSFSGTDRLRARLQWGNYVRFVEPGNGETRLGFDTNTSGNITLDTLSYQFGIGEQITTAVFANGGALDDLAFGNVISPFESSARGAISRFGRYNPIYRAGDTNAGLGVSFRLTNPAVTTNVFSIQAGYLAGEAEDPSLGAGLFNGNYGILAQVTGRNLFDFLDVALTYVHSYTGDETGIPWGVGSRRARIDVNRPVVANSYGLQLNVRPFEGVQIGGWVGYTAGRVIGTGDADIWNWAATVAFPNLGGAGNLGGIVVGMQPRLAYSSPGLRSELGAFNDPNAGLHIEGFYRFAISDNIDITPGIVWLTDPNHNEANDSTIIGTIRTTFRF